MEDKVLTTGCKLLALCKNPVIMNDTMKRSDFSSSGNILKVRELLLNCKEIISSNGDNKEKVKSELSPKWIALSTMEKAFLSTVSLEDMSSTMRRVGGNFKERLQELGGLDSVFDITTNCCSTMEGWLKSNLPCVCKLKDDVVLENIMLLLKYLKIMENAMFLSKENQSSSSISNVVKSQHVSDGNSDASEIPLMEDRVLRDGTISNNSSRECCSIMEYVFLMKSLRLPQKRQWLFSFSGFSLSSSETTVDFVADVCSMKWDDNSLTSGSYCGHEGVQMVELL